MLSRRIAAARPLSRTIISTPRTATLVQRRCASTEEIDPEVIDPRQNGGYPNPPAIKRQLRDPYGDWWDKQERRNYGEIVHEDNDLLGVFTPHDYTHFSSSKAFGLFGFFLLGVAGICGVTYIYYPDKPSVPKTYEGGLEKELGGETVVIARKAGDEWNGTTL